MEDAVTPSTGYIVKIEIHRRTIDARRTLAVAGPPDLKAADDADSRPASGPLHGVPFTIKENIDVLGTPTTQGVPAFADAIPTHNAPVARRMKAADAIPIGRTNLTELASRLSTDNPLYGRTLNPWNASLTAGGSRGGDAVALATGMTPFGIGNDICGSPRNPACG